MMPPTWGAIKGAGVCREMKVPKSVGWWLQNEVERGARRGAGRGGPKASSADVNQPKHCLFMRGKSESSLCSNDKQRLTPHNEDASDARSQKNHSMRTTL